MISTSHAVRFLNHATFGATPSTIADLKTLGSASDWIDQQLELPMSETLPFVRANGNGSSPISRHDIWWRNAMTGDDQLRQRLAYAWSQIFVVSDRDYTLSNAQYGVSGYYDMLAAGSTGNFRDLLESVTLHPVMGIYLSMVRNEKADGERNVRPDENFAREVLQLFTLGLYRLKPDGQLLLHNGKPLPTFDQAIVEEFARVFTGWNFAETNTWVSGDMTKFNKELPMQPVEEYHDRGAKRLLRRKGAQGGVSARPELGRALDNIFAHPNVGPFVALNLIRRLVTSNPSPGYVRSVVGVFNDNGRGERGDLAAVSKAVLTHSEERIGPWRPKQSYGKFKEPILRLTQVWRALEATPGPSANGVFHTKTRPAYRIEGVLGQAPLRAPSVFNFYNDDYPLGDGSALVAPELQILSEVNMAATNNMLFQLIYSHHNRAEVPDHVAQISIEPQLRLATDPTQLVNNLNVLLTGGLLPKEYRQAIVGHLDTLPADDDGLLQRTLDAIYCVVGSPYHIVQM